MISTPLNHRPLVNPFYWSWNTNQWLGVRFNLISCAAIGATGVVILLNKSVSAAAAGFALTFAGFEPLHFEFLTSVDRLFVDLFQTICCYSFIGSPVSSKAWLLLSASKNFAIHPKSHQNILNLDLPLIGHPMARSLFRTWLYVIPYVFVG